MTEQEAVERVFAIMTAITHGMEELAVELIDELDGDDLRAACFTAARIGVGMALGVDLQGKAMLGSTLERIAARYFVDEG